MAACEMMKLTDRQDQIARLAAAGLSNKQIARDLGISEGTVKLHMHGIFNRLGMRSRVVLAAQWPGEKLTDALKPLHARPETMRASGTNSLVSGALSSADAATNSA